MDAPDWDTVIVEAGGGPPTINLGWEQVTGGSSTVITGTPKTVLTTPSLAAGTWLVNLTAVISIMPGATSRVNCYVTAGTATLAGTTPACVIYSVPVAAANITHTGNNTGLYTVTSPGTLVFEAFDELGSNGSELVFFTQGSQGCPVTGSQTCVVCLGPL